MLNLYLIEDWHEEDKFNAVKDIEELFAKLDFSISENDKQFVAMIDEGTLIDDFIFVDRLGYKVNVSNLSTGCKTAIIVSHSDKIISLRECGNNARDAIIKYCNSGSVIMCWNSVTISDWRFDNKVSINVIYRGNSYYFDNVKELNRFLREEY